MSHTAGPWGAYNLSKGNIAIETREGLRIANVSGDSMDVEDNAKLIAAAPDMFEALTKIAQLIRDKAEHADSETLFALLSIKVDIAVAAIAKAEGGK